LATCLSLNVEFCGVIGGAAMVSFSFSNRAISIKAISFALIGAVNTVVDYSVFLFASAVLKEIVASRVPSGSRETLLLVTANMTSWLIAVTGSYLMNSLITFAVESGHKLRWRAYAVFVVSGMAGLLANTVTLVFGAQVLLLPIWIAKAAAILASFIVNFSLSHFVVFRIRDASWSDAHWEMMNKFN
jgi:putative flippase GtrA